MLDTIATVAQCVHTEEQCSPQRRLATLVEHSCQSGLAEVADREAVIDRYQKVLALLEKTDKSNLNHYC